MTDAVLRDITEKKLLEAQLLQAQKMEVVGQLSGGIAHDFNNILTAVIGFGNLLKMNLREDDDQHRYLDQILSAADRAARLTSSLLAFSRRQIVDLRQVRLNEIITRLEQLLQRVIGEDIELKIYLSHQEAPVLADSGQIEQVLMNLCANARDAMPQGGTLMIETEIVEFDEEYVRIHTFTKPGKYMLVSISDTGFGMDGQTRAKIFEPFFTTKEVGKGTGLGLSMAYGIVRQHDGYINVYSEKGRGTTFKIYLPVAEGEASAVQAKPALEFAPTVTGTETILLAEDEPALREYAKDVLEKHGYQVITAENGEDALEKYKRYSIAIDLLVFDVIMPKKNGKEAYDEIRRQRPDMKALFMSGYTANIIHNKGVLEVGLELIAKPFTPSSLAKKVRVVLDKK
jgi:nitrogen-specific signal transduction histidine kinase/CheY-like chemotaxis protein